ncbi:DNA replication complex GINS protein PSF3 [Nasonia vitripennis]|uniref:DNA replication complex GINS protein PSF3 n=1 Tax=Nasonia vitripennis TaxID=7425 RepID=A0A7M7LJ28_NASVI|nr:DNA replication complex GINS protein PSF3 [Nasonia vitripennis]
MSMLGLNSYFSITDILVTEERIHSEIKKLLPNLGFLCPSSDRQDLEPGTRIDLPLWLADALSKSRQPIVTCETPKIFKDSYKEILHADACAVELSKWCQHYYELGLHLPQMSVEDSSKLAEFLLEVFKSRFVVIIDWEHNVSTPALKGQISVLEKKLYLQGDIGRQQLLNWLNKGVKHIKTSTVLNNIRKRKRMDV